MKGQYFSFDALVAAVIMILAFTSLLSYWYSTQYVIESHNSDLRADAMRVADSLFSPGSPANWETNLASVRQIGITNGFSNDLSVAKINRTERFADQNAASYLMFKNMLLVPGDANVAITIRQFDSTYAGPNCNAAYSACQIGTLPPANAREVAIVSRGAILNGKPAQVRVYLWRQ